ncbi:Phospholipid phosphatase homolog 1.2 homolog [Eumeta japonica]|uniref:Phospholipid phosphatase homolog 1.2 homolog n=1 Tax=Eumeta variegata TaxID=151549 RepID=A0A4C1VDU4_EUMVA|nr:Phospholipid phosphatase homolog 1.2 homolog [Eumeta japonica]
MGVIPCHKSGFFCNDPSLNYEFKGDTVSALLLMAVIISVPPKVILITEYFLYKQPDYVLKESFKKKCFKLFKIKWWLTKDYMFGMFFNLAVVEVMKGLTGMPRPTFFDLCKPDAAANCTESTFVSEFACTSSYHWWYQLDSYRSFPSGHASLSIHAGFYTIWYLQRRAFSWNARPMLLVPLLQLACVVFAAVASLTRITDHRHHWWDVLVGAIIGFSTVWYTCMILCDNFRSLERYCDLTNDDKERSIQKRPVRVEDTRLVITPEINA